jgi:hypothetical protein
MGHGHAHTPASNAFFFETQQGKKIVMARLLPKIFSLPPITSNI